MRHDVFMYIYTNTTRLREHILDFEIYIGTFLFILLLGIQSIIYSFEFNIIHIYKVIHQTYLPPSLHFSSILQHSKSDFWNF